MSKSYPEGTPKPIETVYRGYRFRSRLEARWAVFFDSLGIRWDYEPEGFDLPSGRRYLPDFFLHNVGLREWSDKGIWAEVKPDYPTGREREIIEEFACKQNYGIDEIPWLTGDPNERHVVLLVGTPAIDSDADMGHYQMGPWWDCNMVWMRCHECGRIKLEFRESSYDVCQRCGDKTWMDHPTLLAAESAARAIRLERHG